MCLITEGIDQDSCETYTVGGNNRVWLINKSQVEKIFYNTDGSVADIVLKNVSVGVWRVMYPVKVADNTAGGNSELVIGTGKHLLHRLVGTIPLVTQEALNLASEIGLGNFFALVETKTASEWPNFITENKIMFLGGKNGMTAESVAPNLGLAVADGQTIPFAIAGAQTKNMAEVRLTYNAVPVAPTNTTKGEYSSQADWIARLLDSAAI